MDGERDWATYPLLQLWRAQYAPRVAGAVRRVKGWWGWGGGTEEEGGLEKGGVAGKGEGEAAVSAQQQRGLVGAVMGAWPLCMSRDRTVSMFSSTSSSSSVGGVGGGAGGEV